MTAVLILVLAIGFSIGVSAAGSTEEIRALLNYGITIKLDGVTQTMYDANGSRVYPISYKGATYLSMMHTNMTETTVYDRVS